MRHARIDIIQLGNRDSECRSDDNRVESGELVRGVRVFMALHCRWSR